MRRVQKIGVCFAEIIRRPGRSDANKLADIANIFLWLLKVALLLRLQFRLGVRRRRRIRNKLKVVQVLRQRRQSSNVIVDLINFIVFVRSYLTIRSRFLLLLEVSVDRVLQNVAV